MNLIFSTTTPALLRQKIFQFKINSIEFVILLQGARLRYNYEVITKKKRKIESPISIEKESQEKN